MPTEGLTLDHVKKESNLQECWPMTVPVFLVLANFRLIST